MKNILFIVIAIFAASVALYLGLMRNTEKLLEEDAAIVEKVDISKKAKFKLYEPTVKKVDSAKKKKELNKKKIVDTSLKNVNVSEKPIRPTYFTSRKMTDTEYRIWRDAENKLNAPIIQVCFIKKFDTDGDGVLNTEEINQFAKTMENAVKKSLQKQGIDVDDSEAYAEAKNEKLKSIINDGKRKERERRDALYAQFGYEEGVGFPPGQREKMIEHTLNDLENVIMDVYNEGGLAL